MPELDDLPPWEPPADLPPFAAFGPWSELGSPTVSVVGAPGIHVGAFVKIGAYAVLEALVPDRGVTLRIGDAASTF